MSTSVVAYPEKDARGEYGDKAGKSCEYGEGYAVVLRDELPIVLLTLCQTLPF